MPSGKSSRVLSPGVRSSPFSLLSFSLLGGRKNEGKKEEERNDLANETEEEEKLLQLEPIPTDLFVKITFDMYFYCERQESSSSGYKKS